MESLHRYRALEAFCRQRAKMDGESASFWLAEAEAEAWKSRLRRSALNSRQGEDCSKGAGDELRFNSNESNDEHRDRLVP
jgi:hypothetical protein